MTGATPPETAGPFLERGGWRRVRSAAAALMRVARRTIERTLHGSRRRNARSRLAGLHAAERFLVVCYGNICRSPYAAAVLSRTLSDRGRAGTVLQGGFWGPNRPANDLAQRVSEGRGIDLGRHLSRLVTAEDVSMVDLVIVMEPDQATQVMRRFRCPAERVLVLGDLDPAGGQPRSIPDPYGLDRQFFENVYDRIDLCIGEMVRFVPARTSGEPPGMP